MNTSEAINLLHHHKKELTLQQYRTLKGQISAGDEEGAMKGLQKILDRDKKKRMISRFRTAQAYGIYGKALKEIKNGKKKTHWMWFIFPQIEGLGYSATAKYYAIKDRAEAEKYMDNPILGRRLREISEALLKLKTNDPVKIFGEIDAQKLQSSMTLFWIVSKESVFKQVLDKYFCGDMDSFTVSKVKEKNNRERLQICK